MLIRDKRKSNNIERKKEKGGKIKREDRTNKVLFNFLPKRNFIEYYF